jgi:hypothetical protein
MNKRKILSGNTFAAFAKITVAIAALLVLAPVIQKANTVSSSEVDSLLYKYLDRYNNAVREEPGLAEIIVSAETNPDLLTEQNKKIYLDYQRKFFDKWEVAWTYHRAGQLELERWDTWNSWFVAEAMRRPQFGWIQNRQHYSEYFLRHVDESIGIPKIESRSQGAPIYSSVTKLPAQHQPEPGTNR